MAKSDLLQRLWPETFVIEKNLANLVSELRGALGDDPANPRFIRTVLRYGWAFHAVIDDGTASGHASVAEATCVVRWTGGSVRLGDGEHILGRDPDAPILLDSPGVSRQHARLTVSAGRATIEDLGSKNGTSVGDHRIDGPLVLRDGDTIRVGDVLLTFGLLHAPGSTETVAR
jgi:hypothetical protein